MSKTDIIWKALCGNEPEQTVIEQLSIDKNDLSFIEAFGVSEEAAERYKSIVNGLSNYAAHASGRGVTKERFIYNGIYQLVRIVAVERAGDKISERENKVREIVKGLGLKESLAKKLYQDLLDNGGINTNLVIMV